MDHIKYLLKTCFFVGLTVFVGVVYAADGSRANGARLDGSVLTDSSQDNDRQARGNASDEESNSLALTMPAEKSLAAEPYTVEEKFAEVDDTQEKKVKYCRVDKDNKVIKSVPTASCCKDPKGNLVKNPENKNTNAKCENKVYQCEVDKNNKVIKGKSLPSALCCKDPKGKLVKNPENKNKNVVCCGDSKKDGGKGDKSQQSYSSLVSKAHTFYNEMASKKEQIKDLQKEIKQLNKEKDELLAENVKRDVSDSEIEEIENKIDTIEDDIYDLKAENEALSDKIKDTLKDAEGLKGQVKGVSEVGHLTGLAGKLDVDGKVACIRGDGKSCL